MMSFHTITDYFRRPNQDWFKISIGLSVAVHLLLMGLFGIQSLWRAFDTSRTIEIDLTKPFRIGGSSLLKPGGGTTQETPKNPGPPRLVEKGEEKTVAPEPPKDWVLPGPNTKIIEQPQVEQAPVGTPSPHGIPDGEGDGYKGTGGGLGGGDGEGGGIALSQFPRLLNRPEIMRLLRRMYPEAERAAGVEGVVVVDLHLDAKGVVTGVDVVEPTGGGFDPVAGQVARRMKFSPAMVAAGPVAVKLRQTITFRLED